MNRVNEIIEYPFDRANLIPGEMVQEILSMPYSSMVALNNNGFLDCFILEGVKVFCQFQVKTLLKCDIGSLLGYKGLESLSVNAEIFEEELLKLSV